MPAYIRSEAPRLRSGAILGALLVLLILLLPLFPILWPFLRACHRWTLRGPNGGERRRSIAMVCGFSLCTQYGAGIVRVNKMVPGLIGIYLNENV